MKIKTILEKVFDFNYRLAINRLIGTSLCAGAVCLPMYLPLHPQLVNPYYGLMLWTIGLLILHRPNANNR